MRGDAPSAPICQLVAHAYKIPGVPIRDEIMNLFADRFARACEALSKCALALGLLLVSGCGSGADPEPAEPLNVLFISVDTLRPRPPRGLRLRASDIAQPRPLRITGHVVRGRIRAPRTNVALVVFDPDLPISTQPRRSQERNKLPAGGPFDRPRFARRTWLRYGGVSYQHEEGPIAGIRPHEGLRRQEKRHQSYDRRDRVARRPGWTIPVLPVGSLSFTAPDLRSACQVRGDVRARLRRSDRW